MTSAKGSLLFGCVAAALAFMLLPTGTSYAYSVLTHEEIVDLVWTSEIRPLLVHRFPYLTEDQIKEAHAYAYGGSVIQDLGYYPFGNKDFSDLVHYVRSGDFVLELLHQSQDANEYAFALGALSHYAADICGHPAVNQAVALRYPKLRAKYGNSVRYAQDTTAHLKTEFGFDTLQVAKNRYASDQYHDFIGFKVAQPLLERAFSVVYGLQLKDVLTHEDLAVGSYRYSVSQSDSADDQGCAADAQERTDAGDAQLCKAEVSVPPVALRLRAGVGKDIHKAGPRHTSLVSAPAILSKNRPLQGIGIR